MKNDNKILLRDGLLLTFLIYVYTWRLGPWYQWPRLSMALQLFFLSSAFYFFVRKVCQVSTSSVLLGTVVFVFSGSVFTSLPSLDKFPYIGIIPMLFIALYPQGNIRRSRRLFSAAFALFLLSTVTKVVNMPWFITTSVRIAFNCVGALLVAYAMDHQKGARAKTKILFLKAWKFILLLLPVCYAVLFLFVESGAQLLPNLLSWLVCFEFYLFWVLVITSKRAGAITELAPFIVIFLSAVDICTYWVL